MHDCGTLHNTNNSNSKMNAALCKQNIESKIQTKVNRRKRDNT